MVTKNIIYLNDGPIVQGVQTKKYFQLTKSSKDVIKIIIFIYSKKISSLDTPIPKTTLILHIVSYATFERSFDCPCKL